MSEVKNILDFMKNWIKILTLAGFILGGVMLHSSVFASTYSQGLSNGWINGFCNYPYLTYKNSTGCSGSSQISGTNGTSGHIYEFINNGGSTLSSLGSVTSISSITLTTNVIGDSFSDVMHLVCDSGSYNSVSTTIPVGENDVTFNFSSPANCGSQSTYIYFSLDVNGGYNWQNDSTGWGSGGGQDYVAGYNSSIAQLGVGLSNGSPDGNPNYTLKFAINGSFFTAVTITNPPAWVNIYGLDYEIPVDGTCPENGTSTMVVSWPGAPYTTEAVTCTDHLFSVSIPTRDLGTFTAVFTSLCYLPDNNPLCTASYTYTVSPDFYNWNFQVNYPRPKSDGVTYNLQTQGLAATSTFPFRYVYLVPTGTPLSSVSINVRQYTTNTFTAPLDGGVDATSTLADLTYGVPIPQTEFEDNHIVVGESTNYYKVTMWSNGVMRAFVLIAVNIDNSIDGQKPTLPALAAGGNNPCNMDIFGYSLCWLVVPSQANMQDIMSTEQELLANVVPFSYVQQALTAVNSQVITTSSPPALAMVIPANLSNGATTTANLPIFESTVDTAPRNSLMVSIRPYLVAAMWIYFIYFIIKEVTSINWGG